MNISSSQFIENYPQESKLADCRSLHKSKQVLFNSINKEISLTHIRKDFKTVNLSQCFPKWRLDQFFSKGLSLIGMILQI